MKKIKLTKIPSIVRNLNLDYEVKISKKIESKEGNVLIAEVKNHDNYFNEIEYQNGRIGSVVKGEIIPVALGKRRATGYYSSDIPNNIKPGDTLSLTSPGGLVGKLIGINSCNFDKPPVSLNILGALTIDGKLANIKDFGITSKNTIQNSVPIVLSIGSGMESGKTTTIQNIIGLISDNGKKIVAGKITGTAYMQDILKYKDAGAEKVYDFVDGGLPTTCGELEGVVESAISIINKLNEQNPDIILLELGAGIIDEYNVYELISQPIIKNLISFTIVNTFDYVSLFSIKNLLEKIDLDIDVISGPICNNPTSKAFISKKFELTALNNLSETDKIIEKIYNKLIIK